MFISDLAAALPFLLGKRICEGKDMHLRISEAKSITTAIGHLLHAGMNFHVGIVCSL